MSRSRTRDERAWLLNYCDQAARLGQLRYSPTPARLYPWGYRLAVSPALLALVLQRCADRGVQARRIP
jgi:hypothetical protein